MTGRDAGVADRAAARARDERATGTSSTSGRSSSSRSPRRRAGRVRAIPAASRLRFARVKGYRPDKSPAEADTIDAVRAIRARASRLVRPQSTRLRRLGHDALRKRFARGRSSRRSSASGMIAAFIGCDRVGIRRSRAAGRRSASSCIGLPVSIFIATIPIALAPGHARHRRRWRHGGRPLATVSESTVEELSSAGRGRSAPEDDGGHRSCWASSP